jgi:hypothetical protein
MTAREPAAGTMPITQHSPAPDGHELEITPEMIEAGTRRIRDM